MLRVGYISGAFAVRRREELRTFSGVGRMIAALSERSAWLTFGLSSCSDARPEFDADLSGVAGCFSPLPWMPSIASGAKEDRAVRSVIRSIEDRCEVLIVQLPFSTPSALWPARRPRVYHVCADAVGVVAASEFYRGLVRGAAIGAATAMSVWQRWLLRQEATRSVVNGWDLYSELGGPAGRVVVSSSLRRDEIGSVTRSRSQASTARVLFVGFFRPEKGLDVLVKALHTVAARRPDIELAMVGKRDLGEGGAEARLLDDLEQLSRVCRVHFLGHRKFGPELFQCFADADVCVVPSRSEGTPRVLVEARAFGCPVIASRVGGIPSSVTDRVDGLLFPPGEDGKLAECILELLENEGLRRTLIENGRKRAQTLTVDALADALLEEAEIACGRRPDEREQR